MRAVGRSVATFLALAGVCGLAACGPAEEPAVTSNEPALSYRSGLPLEVIRTPRPREGKLRVAKITYRSVDGQRVPALFSVPADQPPLGCLIYVGGFGTTKESAPDLREGLGALRLATFSIDPRNLGDRGSPEDAAAAVSTPEGVRAMLLGTVADLRMGLDYLSQRSECNQNISIMGTSFGGAVSNLVAAQDPRVKSAILTSIGATFKQFLLVRPLAASGITNLPDYVPGASSDQKALTKALRVLGPYDNKKWIGKIAPRPVLIMQGRWDPLVVPADAIELQAAAGSPKTVVFYDGGHDPFVAGPARDLNIIRAVRFLITTMNLPYPI